MDNYHNGFPDNNNKKGSHYGRGILIGLLIGAMLAAAILLFFGYNSYRQDIGAPPAEDAEGLPAVNEGRQPELDDPAGPDDPAESSAPLEISSGAMEYYMAVVNAAEKATPPVVGVSSFGEVFDFFGRNSRQQQLGSGSGVIIRSDGYIVTNYHVIEGSEELIVNLGSGEEYYAEVIGVDPPTDLAVIKIDKQGLPVAEIADSSKLRVGEPAIAIGNPLGLDFQQSVTFGVVSALERVITIQGQRFSFIQTDAAINDGNSGGALVNIYGQLIGINTAKIKITGVEGMGFAIPSNTVRQVTNALIESGKVTRPWMGVYISTLTPLEAERLELYVDSGVLVQDVVQGGPAYKAGVLSMDVIIEFEGIEIVDIMQLQQLLQKYSVGQSVEVLLARGQENVTLQVVLEVLPDQIN